MNLLADPPRTMEEKRNAAKAYLGARWVLHPKYAFRPEHHPAAKPVVLTRKEQ